MDRNLTEDVKNVAATISGVQSSTAKSSLMRLTKDQIFQFPVIMEADINDDEKFPIIKSLEKNYASMVVIAITNAGVIDRDKYNTINDFLRQFHNNDSNSFILTEALATEGYLPEKDLLELWDCIEEQLDTESINNIYLPYKRTAAKLTRAIESAHVALEAEELFYRRVKYAKTESGKYIAAVSKNGNVDYEYIPADGVNSPKLRSLYGEAKTMKEWGVDPSNPPEPVYTPTVTGAEMIKDEKFNALTPTLIKLTITNIKKGAGAPWNQQLSIGVKAMPRMIPQSIMISNLLEMLKERMVFKFIKWTRGEIKWADIFFGISQARDDATAKQDRRWLKILRKRSKDAKSRRFSFGASQKLNPNCSLIITAADVHTIREQWGLDVGDVKNVLRIMDKYFLLAFGIYDTEAKMLDIIYDGETEFTTYSLRTMIAETKKDTNLLSMSKY